MKSRKRPPRLQLGLSVVPIAASCFHSRRAEASAIWLLCPPVEVLAGVLVVHATVGASIGGFFIWRGARNRARARQVALTPTFDPTARNSGLTVSGSF